MDAYRLLYIFYGVVKDLFVRFLGFNKNVFKVSISKSEIQILKGEIYAGKNAKIW
jgi:hypothetical protein